MFKNTFYCHFLCFEWYNKSICWINNFVHGIQFVG
jgi:hypothetical protein